MTVQLPAQPRRQEIPIEGVGGPGRTVLYVVKDDAGVFISGWADYAPDFKFDDQAELAANRDNFVKGVQGATLLDSRPIPSAGSPGIEFTARKPGA